MKLVKTASGKQTVSISKKEWESIGKTAGWMNKEVVAKKKDKKDKKSPKEHGFMDQCIEENKDKDNPGAYCASIVDKVKGTTDWRKGPRK